ncbi:hypothetical protein SAMN04488021_14135 [Paracoccus aminovorans]|uniref:Uncharacterized protein n=1 Tax=Paracoccus aminovorans TaxID=34004 RepID=A0A1I3DRI3_9RHOB|nr:hypothetical protein [Paracoccus aminovorans]CQR85321.1 hypothetical protein JCM7685_0741 [Paracoccus aminovorans]SFH89273.1 hypothetical protein SAMN04488021_14135 [Paracoccus aminovorans]
MSRIGTNLLTLAALVFVASTMLYAFWPAAPVPPSPPADSLVLSEQVPPVDLAQLFLRPDSPAMTGLLAATWAALGYHALRLRLEGRRLARARQAAEIEGRPLPPQGAGPPVPGDLLRLHERDGNLAEHGPLIVSLLVGALWPWLLSPYPLISFLLSTVTLAGTLAAALRGVRVGPVVQRSSTLGFVAGWALLVSFALFTGLLEQRLGVPQTSAALIALLIGAVAAVGVQLRMPKRIGFSVALIWGLIGIAAGTVTTDATIATATVVAIAIIAVALVRVTT